MQAQDSSDPTGVRHVGALNPGAPARARNRKANAAVSMRLAGATWNEIASALGYPTPRQALVATEKALERNLLEEDRNSLRRLAGARLDRLLMSVWPKAINGDHPEHLYAVTKARELIDRHAKLFGLDAPTEIVVHNPTQTELESWVASVVSLGVPPVQEFDILEGEIVEAIEGEAEQA